MNLKAVLWLVTLGLFLSLIYVFTLICSARAQVTTNDFILLQNGAKVGEIYVPQYESGAINYVER